VIAGLYKRGKFGQLYMVSTSPENALAIGRFMTTLILEVGTRFEFYINGVIIVITRQSHSFVHPCRFQQHYGESGIIAYSSDKSLGS
jgi:hypothetical protein